MTGEELKKCTDMIGKEIFIISHAYEARPYVKAVSVTSIEIYKGDYIQLKTPNEGSYRYGCGSYYETYEEAQKQIEKYYCGEKTKLEPLKECPICKSSARVCQYAHKYQIECAECGISTKPVSKLKDAIMLWNERKN